MNKTFFAADPHFNDDNIRRYERPHFESVQVMNEWMIKGWERVVGEDDNIFIVGDVGREVHGSNSIIGNLPGKKHLILGNHDLEVDYDPLIFWRDAGFDFIYLYPILYGGFYIISHEPAYLNPQMPYANIHGHIHANKMVSAGKFNQYINVSWEHLPNGEPLNFEDIKAIYK